MAARSVKDSGGRTWACRQDDTSAMRGDAPQDQGKDVSILCTTETVTIPVRITVGWQWATMSENGLARLIAEASPVPKKVSAGAI